MNKTKITNNLADKKESGLRKRVFELEKIVKEIASKNTLYDDSGIVSRIDKLEKKDVTYDDSSIISKIDSLEYKLNSFQKQMDSLRKELTREINTAQCKVDRLQNNAINELESKINSLSNYDDSELRQMIDGINPYDDSEIRELISNIKSESIKGYCDFATKEEVKSMVNNIEAYDDSKLISAIESKENYDDTEIKESIKKVESKCLSLSKHIESLRKEIIREINTTQCKIDRIKKEG